MPSKKSTPTRRQPPKRPTPAKKSASKPTAKAVPFPAYPAKPNGPRELHTHQVPGTDGAHLNDKVRIFVCDDPGPGGANHSYQVHVPGRLGDTTHNIVFQKGGVQEEGVNGLSNESLLALVKDRLEGFQSGPFASLPNHAALTCVDAAVEALHSRTRDRIARGVEGQAKA